MSTNQKDYKKTRQIRIGEKWHRKIKLSAAETGETMTENLERLLQLSEVHKDVFFISTHGEFNRRLAEREISLSEDERVGIETIIGCYFDEALDSCIDDTLKSKNQEPQEITNTNENGHNPTLKQVTTGQPRAGTSGLNSIAESTQNEIQ